MQGCHGLHGASHCTTSFCLVLLKVLKYASSGGVNGVKAQSCAVLRCIQMKQDKLVFCSCHMALAEMNSCQYVH